MTLNVKLLIWSGHSEGSQFLLQHFDSSVQDVVQAAVGGVMMYGIFFLARFKPLIHHHYLSIVADHSTVLWPQCTHLLMAASSSLLRHVTELKSSQSDFLNMNMYSLHSNGLHSLQISIQKSTFEMRWNSRFSSCAADKSAGSLWCRQY